MPTIRPITSLDFDQIKSEIINYIKNNPTFSDYNFEGSALNAIVDMLAFNTHTNAYYANMLHNESFIDTAQKRSSVVSRAKELGYTPRSSVCSSANINISAVEDSIDISSTTIERGTKFTSTNDNGSYEFSLTDNVVSLVDGNTHNFYNLKLVDGQRTSNYFKVDLLSNIRSIFTIPNKNIDTSTLKVFIRDSISAIEKVEYTLTENIYELDSDSKVYFLQESYDGFFQIYFGNDVIGKQPVSGNIVDLDYFVANNNNLADGCRQFTVDGAIGNSNSINIETIQVSFGGAEKETIESIKFNAIKSNSAKGRSVSPSDYVLALKEKFNFIKTASVWGGEDNTPPVYGKVFISIQPVSGYTISDYIKNNVITPAIRANSLMTIGVEYVDPTYLDLQFVTNVKFNSNKTTRTKSEVEILIKEAISYYVNSISTFNKDYLESSLTAKLMSIDAGIVSVSLSKRVSYKLTPLIGVESNYIKSIDNAIVAGTILSNKFNIIYKNDITPVYIKEITDQTIKVSNLDKTTSIRSAIGLYSENNILMKEIGYVDLKKGEFNLTFGVNSYVSSKRFITIQFSLDDDNITTSKNQILRLAKTVDTSMGLFNNNTIIMENYGK